MPEGGEKDFFEKKGKQLCSNGEQGRKEGSECERSPPSEKKRKKHV